MTGVSVMPIWGMIWEQLPTSAWATVMVTPPMKLSCQ
jgi:hypothetical protein